MLTLAGGDEDRPLAGYALTMAACGTVVGALAGMARLTGRDVPDRVPVTDVALGAQSNPACSANNA